MEAKIFLIEIDDDLDDSTIKACHSMLHDDQKTRYGQYVFGKDQISYLSRQTAAKLILHREFGIPEDKLHFQFNPYGKPFIRDWRGSFSISKSGNHVAIGVHADGNIGVDIEKLKPGIVSELDMHSIFTEAEILKIGNSDSECIRFWTLKEAYVKYLGLGLSKELMEIDLSHWEDSLIIDNNYKIHRNIYNQEVRNLREACFLTAIADTGSLMEVVQLRFSEFYAKYGTGHRY